MRPDKTPHVSAQRNFAQPQADPALPPVIRNWGDVFHYRALFEQLDECIFIISFDLYYLAANPQALDLLGYQESELIGRPVSEIVFIDDANDPYAAEEDASLLVRLLRCKNGQVVPVEISSSLVVDEAGRPAYIQSIARNITRRKQAEQALKRFNQILLSISEATGRLLQSTQIENNITDVLELLGKAIGASSCSILEINPQTGDWAQRAQAEWQQPGSSHTELSNLLAPYARAVLRQTSGIYAVNIGFSPPLSLGVVQIAGRPGAREFLVLIYPTTLEGWLLAQQDALKIAANIIGAALQRYEREEAIVLSEARHSSIIAALPDLIIRLDAQGRILDYSARPDHPLYRPPHLAAGRLFSEIWPPEIVNNILGANEHGTFSEAYHLKEFKLPFSARTYESRLSPIASHEALLVIRDVTEQARLSEMKSDFINRASHELRTPLTTVIMMANLLQEGGTPAQLREYWAVMTSELNRQKILIERLLMAGRLESGTMKLELGPIDLIASLEESILAVKPMASKKKITIRFDIPMRPLPVLGDNSALQQVFINLMNNATKFSPAGSSVEVSIDVQENEAVVSICDHGMGIPPEDLPHMCERFFRGRNMTIAEIPGSGIGLYIVKSILEELNGDIKIESTLQVGTTLIVTLKRFG